MTFGVDMSPVSTREKEECAVCYVDFVCRLSVSVCGIALNQTMYANRIIIYELQILRLEIIKERERKRKNVQRESETKRVHVGARCSHFGI